VTAIAHCDCTISGTLVLADTHGQYHLQVTVSVSVTVLLAPLVFTGAR
jgi:hypothetical protein